jgi:hypothetical protein
LVYSANKNLFFLTAPNPTCLLHNIPKINPSLLRSFRIVDFFSLDHALFLLLLLPISAPRITFPSIMQLEYFLLLDKEITQLEYFLLLDKEITQLEYFLPSTYLLHVFERSPWRVFPTACVNPSTPFGPENLSFLMIVEGMTT